MINKELSDLALVISAHADRVYQNVKEADERMGHVVHIAMTTGIPVGLVAPTLEAAQALEADRKEVIVLFYEAARLSREARLAVAVDLRDAALAVTA